MMDGTPIIDIKPYIPYTDCRPEAVGGFTKGIEGSTLNVNIPENLHSLLSATELKTLREILTDDPRPQYQNDPLRVYKFTYSKYEIAFRVEEGELSVISIDRKQ